jgi:hypothetical protein
MCFDFLYTFCLKCFLFYEEFSDILLQIYVGIYVKHPLFLLVLIKFKFSLQIFEKAINTKFHGNPSSGNGCSLRTDGQTNRTKLTVAFCNFAKASKKTVL